MRALDREQGITACGRSGLPFLSANAPEPSGRTSLSTRSESTSPPLFELRGGPIRGGPIQGSSQNRSTPEIVAHSRGAMSFLFPEAGHGSQHDLAHLGD